MARTLRPESIFPITTRRLSVVRVADVTPGMRRVTLGGPGLAAHLADNGHPVAAFRSDGFDDEFKLIVPDPATGKAYPPTQVDGTLDWPRGSFSGTRTYTVRRWDPVAGEIDVDIARHGAGPGTTWAYRCRPGDPIDVAGPKMSYGQPQVEWLLIGGDETALPAIGRWLEELAPGTPARVFIEVESRDHIQELATAGDATISWLSRDGAPAGTTTLLADALRAAAWPSDDVFVWVAGEAITLAPIRRWLRNDKGLPRERVEVTGYWRRAGAEVDGGSQVAAPEADADEQLHELLELVPPVAIRVASTLGVFAQLGREPLTSDQLAERVSADPGALARLLRYLAELELVALGDTSRWALLPLGAELDDDSYAEHLDLTRAEGKAELGIVGLLDAVRTGRAGYPATFGQSFTDAIAAESAASAGRLGSELAEWTASALADSRTLSGLGELRVTGPGAGDVALAIAGRRGDVALKVLVPPSQADAAGALAWPAPSQVAIEVGGVLDPRPEPTEAYLLVGVLAELPEADAVHVLAQASASTRDGSVLVLDELLDPDLADEHSYESDLRLLAVHGGALRTAAELDALAARAGLATADVETVGWGRSLRRYHPAGTA